ncbi:hypothetical protein [Mucilaginibacter sp.]|uniref:hypothetical protein n=1 Tax=Mucilaginibacter sp. TaxID=1882438 RepID=UPI002847D028|nr:hypothetical protein [Mucilaginibacter sp.]MDR3697222.1 hypothetical protein [Mucilaginibacter sp.]
MTETVTSKFDRMIWFTAFLYSLLILILTGVCAGLATSGNPNNREELFIILAVVIGLSCFYIDRAIRRLISVTIMPDRLVLNYLIINKQVNINYTDILHESVVRERLNSSGGRAIISDTIKLKIELKTGKIFFLYESCYTNFEEMAEAIRRARFKLE